MEKHFGEENSGVGVVKKGFGAISKHFGEEKKGLGVVKKCFGVISKHFGEEKKAVGVVKKCFGVIKNNFGEEEKAVGVIKKHFGEKKKDVSRIKKGAESENSWHDRADNPSFYCTFIVASPKQFRIYQFKTEKIMKSPKMRQAEYPLVGMAVKDSFKRDQTEFAKHYKTMDAAYLTRFETALGEVQAVHAASTGLAEQKKASAKVHLLEEELLRRAAFLKDYAAAAAQDTAPATAAAKALRRGDTEAAVKALRQAVAHYTPQIAAMEDMPQDFLTKIGTDATELERLNNEQNTAMNFRAGLTEENRAKYDTLDAFIAKVSNAGKRIFRGTPKADEYTISKILARIRTSERKKEEETPKAEG